MMVTGPNKKTWERMSKSEREAYRGFLVMMALVFGIFFAICLLRWFGLL